MALISKARLNQKEKIKLEISTEVLQTIKAYCEWSEIDDMDFFIEEAVCYVFAKDKDWKAHQKNVKKADKTIKIN